MGYKQMRYKFFSIGILWVLSLGMAQAFELQTVAVNERVYALVGSTDARTEQNYGLNNTLGFVIGDNSIILVSSGTNADATKLIKDAVSAVSSKPITHVINIGTQDHHWMGNVYFSSGGAKVIALKKTVDSQKANLAPQLERLEHGIKDGINTVKPRHAGTVIDADRHVLEIDGVSLELIWPGKGHYAGDAVLWVPQQATLFTGDFVYMDRMLGIHPTSDVLAWQQSFHRIASMPARHIIPGHGKPTDINGAKRDTGDYLDWLVEKVSASVDEWQDIDETIESLADAPRFQHLRHYESWHRRNIHQAYLQIEAAR
jgi:glyoxylase-like metal-dependent hydrolase (beta-lactamase superfamily II)